MNRDKRKKVKADSKSLRTRSNIGALNKIGKGGSRLDNPFISYMEKFIPKTVFEFRWSGEFLSLNQHIINKRIKDWWRNFLKEKLAKAKRVRKYQLWLKYHSMHDVDNIPAITKLINDAMVDNKVVKNDSPPFQKNLIISYDKSLKRGECVVQIQGLK